VLCAGAADGGIGPLQALLLGLVEGLTEFLPVSSTGHLIVVNRLLGSADPRFEIAIQIGAITAILVLYRRRLLTAARGLLTGSAGGGPNLLVLLVVAAIPAALIGIALEDPLETLFDPLVVAITTLAGGVLLLLLEGWLGRRAAAGAPLAHGLERMTLRDAFGIGLFQCLALIPGTSRSGATIAGALLLGYRRPAAAEFSFLLGLPILYGACLLKLFGGDGGIDAALGRDLLLAMLAAFVSALLVVGPFVRFLERRTFVPFAVYRLLLGTALLGLWWGGAFAPAGLR
jgi:undecaprenyl-diphosphatase